MDYPWQTQASGIKVPFLWKLNPAPSSKLILFMVWMLILGLNIELKIIQGSIYLQNSNYWVLLTVFSEADFGYTN